MTSPYSMVSKACLVLVACLALLTCRSAQVEATALTYNVAAHEKACFYAWADVPGTSIAFYFAVQSGGSFDIDFEVKGPNEKKGPIMKGERERQGDYVFKANDIGEYSFCFSNDMSTFAEKVVDFEILMEHERKAVNDKEKEKAAGSLSSPDSMDDSLFNLSRDLAHVDRLQKYLRTRENRSFSTVLSTESRIFWFSLMESALIVTMSALQVFVVRTFFSSSKRSNV